MRRRLQTYEESDMARYDYDDDEPYIIIERHDGSVGSLLLGVALGAGLALLFAPQSGEETRRDIEERARRARVRAGELADEVSASVSGTIDQARSQVEERLDAARGAVDMRRQQVSRAVEAGRAAAQQARHELERRIAEGKAAYEAGVTAARTQSSATTGTGAAGAGPAAGGPVGGVPGASEVAPAGGAAGA
ncbi:MAG: YtxH domain-containing protein [Gemmatimonadaceae bacterium]